MKWKSKGYIKFQILNWQTINFIVFPDLGQKQEIAGYEIQVGGRRLSNIFALKLG